MYSLAAASQPRMSEIEPKWFMFEASSYAFGRRIRRLWATYAAECKSMNNYAMKSPSTTCYVIQSTH